MSVVMCSEFEISVDFLAQSVLTCSKSELLFVIATTVL